MIMTDLDFRYVQNSDLDLQIAFFVPKNLMHYVKKFINFAFFRNKQNSRDSNEISNPYCSVII